MSKPSNTSKNIARAIGALLALPKVEVSDEELAVLRGLYGRFNLLSKQDCTQLVEHLDAVLDAGGAEESHPLAPLADYLGDLIADCERGHLPMPTSVNGDEIGPFAYRAEDHRGQYICTMPDLERLTDRLLALGFEFDRCTIFALYPDGREEGIQERTIFDEFPEIEKELEGIAKEDEAILEALVDQMKQATSKAEQSIDDALQFVQDSNNRIVLMEENGVTHITKADGNIFADLGFDPKEASKLAKDSRKKNSGKDCQRTIKEG